MTGQHVIEACDIHTRLNGQMIHRGITLRVRARELLAIAGGSGSGKTTLLRELALLNRPTRGRIRLFGHDVDGLPSVLLRRLRTRVGVMFQHGALFGALTVDENVRLPLREHTNLSWRRQTQLVRLKLALAGLPASALSKRPAELSGGMVKRAALARALALDPDLLLLDEPTAGLDPAGAAAFDELILALRDRLMLTVVMVTHDPESLWRVTDRVAFLAQGQVMMCAPVSELAQSELPALREYFSGSRIRAARQRA